VLLNLLH